MGEENGAWVVYGKNQFACNMLKSQFAAKIDAVRAELVPQQAAFAFKPGVGVHYEMAAQAVAPVQVQEVIEVEECVEPVQMPLQTAVVMEEDRPSETVSKPVAAMTAAEILAQRIKNLPHDEPQVQTAAPAESKAVAKAKTDAQQRCGRSALRTDQSVARYTFETLVEGKGNRLAAAAAQAIAENPGQGYNPFFLIRQYRFR